MYDSMPIEVAVPLIIVAWLVFFAVKFHWLNHFQNWAAQRRHKRRMINYMRKDAELAATIYAAQHGRHNLKGMKRP